MNNHYIFTSDSVLAGHPDKLCDQISDAILDSVLAQDPGSRVMVESAFFGNVIFLSLRLATKAGLDVADTARRVVREAGYPAAELNAEDLSVMISQMGVTTGRYQAIDVESLDDAELGLYPAGNQATLFGFATRQTESLMPLPIMLAHQLSRRLEEVATNGELEYLIPDGKCQAAVAYEERSPVRIHSLGLIGCQKEGVKAVSVKRMRDDLIGAVLEPVMAEQALKMDAKTQLYLNPEGAFLGGGPRSHSGLTGRKTAGDTYGEYARHNASALSGKDPLRIERAGSYAARYVAKHIVAAGLADDCEVQLTYTVALAEPISIQVDTFRTGKIPDKEIEARIKEYFDLRPAAIVRDLGLQRIANQPGGYYRHLAAYGQMGREDLQAPWEELNKVDQLRG
jgi:S-adenosylmethionine synthetase